MSDKEYKKITAGFYFKAVRELTAITILAMDGKLDFIHSYHHIHQIKQLAENAITELDNLKQEPGPQPNAPGDYNDQ